MTPFLSLGGREARARMALIPDQRSRPRFPIPQLGKAVGAQLKAGGLESIAGRLEGRGWTASWLRRTCGSSL